MRGREASKRIADAEEAFKAEKTEVRRTELAAAALTTLGQLGYARTSLREIANNTPFSHGLFHYYFADKSDLILCSVRYYKTTCVARYDEIVSIAKTRQALLDGFAAGLAQTLVDDAPLHRLWYDLRAQALFEPLFRDDVEAIEESLKNMVWRVVSRYAALGEREIAMTPDAIHGLLDGLFQKFLLRHIGGDRDAVDGLQSAVRELLPRIA